MVNNRNQLARYAAGRMVKAAGRSRDATFTAIGGTLRSLASSTFSLLGGQERFGWAIGVDGTTARTIDTSAQALLSQLSLNEIVYACLRERMKVLITPAFVVERRQPDGTYVVDHEHELTALLRRPGPNIDAPTLWRCLEASYASIGRLYIEPMTGSATGRLRGLNPLNPVYVTERYEGGILVAYDWQPPDAPGVRFLPDELIVRRAVDWADVPPLIAALGAVEADKLMNDFTRGFFSNAGVPSGIVKVRGSWSEELTNAFRSKWTERFGPGGMAAGGPAIFDENIESYTRLGVSLNELDNETLRMYVETRICMCFGVPPLIVYAYAGLLKATYSNLTEAWASFWDATALPLLKEWAEWINWTLLTRYESEDDVLLGLVRCRFDPSGLGPYQEDVNAKVTQYLDGYDKGTVKLNEVRMVMGLSADPAGDVYKTQPAPVAPPQIAPPVPASDSQNDGTAQKALPIVPATKAAPKTPARLDGDVAKYLREQYSKARRLWVAGQTSEIEKQLDDGLILFGILSVAQRKAYADAWKEAARSIDWDVALASDDVTGAVDQLAARCMGIAGTTRDEIMTAIQGETAGRTLDALAVDRPKTRAPMITATELAVAASSGALAAYTSSGRVQGVTWTVGDKPCPDCKALDGTQYELAAAPEMPAHPSCGCHFEPVMLEVLV
jgi:HK97 family phage portal protein